MFTRPGNIPWDLLRHHICRRQHKEGSVKWRVNLHQHSPRCSMYGIFTYIWAIFRVYVGKYAIHGASALIEKKRTTKVQLGHSWNEFCKKIAFDTQTIHHSAFQIGPVFFQRWPRSSMFGSSNVFIPQPSFKGHIWGWSSLHETWLLKWLWVFELIPFLYWNNWQPDWNIIITCFENS